jgi:hypothetical protein
MKNLFFLFMLLIFSLPTLAAGKKPLVGGTLINGLGSTPLRNCVVLVDGELIERVGTVDTLAVPDGYEVISTEGMSWMYG